MYSSYKYYIHDALCTQSHSFLLCLHARFMLPSSLYLFYHPKHLSEKSIRHTHVLQHVTIAC